MSDSSAHLPFSDVARRVSAHLDGLAAEVFAIEHAIGDELGKVRPIEDDYVKRLQRLDFLRQSLEDLALLNLLISEHCTGKLPECIEPKLRLASTKELLSQRTASTPFIKAEDDIGEVDLF